jgi:DNA-binding transcriptional LysR family regulator
MTTIKTRDGVFRPRVSQETPQLTSTLNLVAAGLGVSIVPESLMHL